MSLNEVYDQQHSVIILSKAQCSNNNQDQIAQMEKITKLENESSQKDKKIKELQDQVKMKDNEIIKLRKTLESVELFQKKSENVTQNSLEQLQEYKKMKQTLKEQSEKITQLEKENKDLLLQTDSVVTESQQVKEEQQKIFASYANNKSQVKVLSQEKDNFQKQISDLQSKIQQLEQELEVQKQENYEMLQLYQKSLQVQSQLESKLQKYKPLQEQSGLEEFFSQTIEWQNQRIINELQKIFESSQEFRDQERYRGNLVKQLNLIFIEKMKKPLELIDITFKHEFRDNRTQE